MSTITSYLSDFAYTITNCLSCFPGSPQLKINGRSFKISRLLGEVSLYPPQHYLGGRLVDQQEQGGFSYVYLVEETSTSSLFALKKIRCPFGQESVSKALKEVEAYALFAPHPNIIHSIDHSISSDKGGDPGAKTVYILLPYYRRGNLQDIINANLVNHVRFDERRLLVLLLGVCRALKGMHQYRVGGGKGVASAGVRAAKKVRREAQEADDEAEEEAMSDMEMEANSSRRLQRKNARNKMRMSNDTEQEPLMDDEVTASQDGVAPGQIRAYAHRDIKPGNIMIADDGHTPILMDLGSLAPSPTPITSRSLALQVQDEAAENSTLPYRAPELFDVKTGGVVDTKVDIWSLGCTVYACLVGKSPFEARSEETGGSLTMCVLGGDWRFPDESGNTNATGKAAGKAPALAANNGGSGGADGGRAGNGGLRVSDCVRNVVRRCLKVEPAERPDVDELIGLVEDCIAELGPPDSQAG